MFRINNRTSLRVGEARFDSLITDATAAIERFLAFNPSRRESVRIDVTHTGSGIYKARTVYMSNQGTSHISTHWTK